MVDNTEVWLPIRVSSRNVHVQDHIGGLDDDDDDGDGGDDDDNDNLGTAPHSVTVE